MNNYNQIDLDDVKGLVSSFASIEDSKSFILNEEVPFNPLIIKRNINETKEFMSLFTKEINITFDGIENINALLIKAKKEVDLTPIEISKVLNFHNHAKRIKKILDSLDNELNIKDYSDSIYINDNLASELNRFVDNYGNIKEDASDKLSEIINQININEKRLFDKAHEFISRHTSSLQEATIFERNNRLTFLIKNSDKNKFNGFTYGTSASGLASYVEPEYLVNLNNNRISLNEDKEQEINRIIKQLTYLIAIDADKYINDFESLLKLDVIYAKAKYGYKNNGILATLGNKLYLKDVCHPLIDLNSVVSNTYTLDTPYQGIVISGTNTGGKTVGLKCIGLSIMMSYLGIPLIASEAIVPLYDQIFVDIDDNQSISNSLSTFSAHISNINNILNRASQKSLILIDELISGTDPKEAQAISLAILNRIETIGSNFVITTHYDDIKNYAYDNPKILLSAVGFDFDNLKPTYKYIENSVGASNALDIADRYFDDKSIIDFARQIVAKSESKQDKLMNELSKEIETNQKLRDENQKILNENIDIQNELKDKISQFEKEKIEIKNKYLNELNDYIDSIKEKAIDKLESIKEVKNNKVIEEIETLKAEEILEKKDSFEVGDPVKISTNDAIGTILEINGNKAIINLNGLSIKTELDKLTKMPKIKKNVIKTNTVQKKTIRKELNIVGKHIDEGLIDVEYFLDDAQINHLSEVKIIHGIGTGQLRNAVREKLKQLKFVKSFKDGDYHDGGSAVTMVSLK